MKFKDYFSSRSDRYKAYRPQYPSELFNYLSSLVNQHKLVWDVATGSGQAALGLSSYFKTVHATDASANQINNATHKLNIHYKVEPAERCTLTDSSVDLVTVAQALHWFDFEAFYPEVYRVLKPEGYLAVWSYGLIRFENHEMDSLIQRFYNGLIRGYWPPERNYIDQEYETIPFPFQELTDTPEFEIRLTHDSDSLINYLSTWSGVRNYITTKGIDPLIELRKDITKLNETEFEAYFPLHLRIGQLK
ncbi:MAG: class I SAM-dependent methyltransferase [Bacteroidota bacterium]